MLPWNTTKTGVDRDSRVFRVTRNQMTTALRSVQTFINQTKQEAQRVPAEARVLSRAIEAAPVRELQAMPMSAVMRYPRAAQRDVPAGRQIQYTVAREDFDRAAGALGTNVASEIGRKTFDFFVETQAADEPA